MRTPSRVPPSGPEHEQERAEAERRRQLRGGEEVRATKSALATSSAVVRAPTATVIAPASAITRPPASKSSRYLPAREVVAAVLRPKRHQHTGGGLDEVVLAEARRAQPAGDEHGRRRRPERRAVLVGTDAPSVDKLGVVEHGALHREPALLEAPRRLDPHAPLEPRAEPTRSLCW
jgi:hypothetical protein